MTPEQKERLEFATREYCVTTENLIDAMTQADIDVPATIKGALGLLASAIVSEWDKDEWS